MEMSYLISMSSMLFKNIYVGSFKPFRGAIQKKFLLGKFFQMCEEKNTKNTLQITFWIKNDPHHPPFGKTQKNHPNLRVLASLEEREGL